MSDVTDPSRRKADPSGSGAAERSWLPGQKGQGGEGLSKGYGGSAGKGTGTSGPDEGKPLKAKRRGDKPNAARGDSPSLPSREKICAEQR